ncbi:MAG: hypothetical protein J6R86_01255, partial [Lentisphaeria bacterium]|nr:hypothetical protein [Lentisphaeria bacterium]
MEKECDFLGEGENFFSREKKFSPSPKPPTSFKKSGVYFAPVGRKTSATSSAKQKNRRQAE